MKARRTLEALRLFGPASAAIAGAMVTRAATQALSLWIVARALGPEGYGAITAIVSVAGAFGYLLAFGAPLHMVNAVARHERDLPQAWREMLAAAMASLPLLLLSYWALAALLPGSIPVVVTACFALAEIAVLPMCQACVYACIAADKRIDAAWLTMVPAVLRLVFAAALWPVVFWLDPERALPVWALLYVAAGLLALAVAIGHIRPWVGRNHRPAWAGLPTAMREGCPFALAGLAQKLASDADKAMLASLASLHAAGTYGLAYRMIEMSQMPLHALGMTTTTHFARRREHGMRVAAHDLIHILPIPMLYAALAVPVLLGAAWLVPSLFGAAFAPASTIIRQMALLPVVMAPRIQIQATLNAAGMQRQVALTHFTGAALGIGLNLFLIPRWGLQGAVTAAYAVEGLVLLLQVLALYSSCRRQPVLD